MGCLKLQKLEYLENGTQLFSEIKKILNLCLRWHNLRSYRFVAEVTSKVIYFGLLSFQYQPVSCLTKILVSQFKKLFYFLETIWMMIHFIQISIFFFLSISMLIQNNKPGSSFFYFTFTQYEFVFGPVITKTTDESQTNTDESQTSTSESKTSHRQVTDD